MNPGDLVWAHVAGEDYLAVVECVYPDRPIANICLVDGTDLVVDLHHLTSAMPGVALGQDALFGGAA
jgi:hypothetical protein